MGTGVWFTCLGESWDRVHNVNARDLDRRGDVQPCFDCVLPMCDVSQVELLDAEPKGVDYAPDGGALWSRRAPSANLDAHAVLLSVVAGEEYWGIFDYGVGGWRIARFVMREGEPPDFALTPALPIVGGPAGVCCHPEEWEVVRSADYPVNPTQPSSKGPAFDYVQCPFLAAVDGRLLTAALWNRDWGGGFCDVTIRYLVLDPVTLAVDSELVEVTRQCANLLDSFPALTPYGAVDIGLETAGSLVRAVATIYPLNGGSFAVRTDWMSTSGTPIGLSGRVYWPGWGVRFPSTSAFCAWSPWVSADGRYVAQPMRVKVYAGEEVVSQLWGTVLVDVLTPSIQWQPVTFGPGGPDEERYFWYPVGVNNLGEIVATTLPPAASSWAYVIANLDNTIRRTGIRYSDLPSNTSPVYSTMLEWSGKLYNLIWVVDEDGDPIIPLYIRWNGLAPDYELIASGLADATAGIRTSPIWKLYAWSGTHGYDSSHRLWYREVTGRAQPSYVTFTTWNEPFRRLPGYEDDGWFAVHGWCPESESGRCPETSEWPDLTDVHWTIYAERRTSDAHPSTYLRRVRLYQSVGADYVFLTLDCEVQNAVYRAPWDCSALVEVWYSEGQYLAFCPDYFRGRRLYLGDSLHPLMYSDDLGDTWHEFPGWPEPYTVACMLSIPEGVLVFTYGSETFLIVDGAQVVRWGATPSPAVDDASYDPTEPHRILACAGRYLYLSVDSGRTWRAVTSPAEAGEDIRRTHLLSRLGWLWSR